MSELWENAKSVRVAMKEQVGRLLDTFAAKDEKHVQTWLSLTADERRSLLTNPYKGSKLLYVIPYIAHRLLLAEPKRPKDAITLYDDLIETAPAGRADVWKKALWVVMPEFTGLPLDRVRCLHYMKKCTPVATCIKGIFENIARVQKSLGDIDACIDALEKAKAQGDDMEGPRDEVFFRDLWHTPRFAALFEGMEPPIYEFNRDDELNSVSDPTMVKRISLGTERISEDLRKFTEVEELELSACSVVPEWLSEFKNLRKISSWALEKIPDEVLCMPSLQEFEAHHLPKGYEDRTLNELLKSFLKDDTAVEARPVHLALVVGRSTKKFSDTQLVEALGSSATQVHRKALTELEGRWKKRMMNLEAGDEIVFVGKLSADRSVLKERLERIEVGSKKKVGKNTAAIVIGPRHGGKALPFMEGRVPVVLESHLHAALDREDKRHFDEADHESAEDSEKLSELLLAANENSATLALEMIKRGGLPDGLLEELFLVAQTQDFSRKVRNTAKKLFERYASAESVQAVQSELKRTNIFASGETKLARRLDALEKKSGGELNGEKIAHAMFARSRDGLKYLLEKAKKPEDRLVLLKRARTGSELSLWNFELTHIPDEVGKLEGITKLDASCNRFKRLPESLKDLSMVETLELGWGRLAELPEWLVDLPKLKVLGVKELRFSNKDAAAKVLSALEDKGVKVER